MSRARRLASIRRAVPAEDAGAYLRAWGEVERLVTARGAHAWRFAAADRPDLHVEFLEFAPDADPRAAAEVAAALRALDGISPGEAEEWVGA